MSAPPDERSLRLQRRNARKAAAQPKEALCISPPSSLVPKRADREASTGADREASTGADREASTGAAAEDTLRDSLTYAPRDTPRDTPRDAPRDALGDALTDVWQTQRERGDDRSVLESDRRLRRIHSMPPYAPSPYEKLVEAPGVPRSPTNVDVSSVNHEEDRNSPCFPTLLGIPPVSNGFRHAISADVVRSNRCEHLPYH